MNEAEMLRHVEAMIRAKFGSQARFARTIGVNANFISEVLSGRKRPSTKILNAAGLLREVTYRSK